MTDNLPTRTRRTWLERHGIYYQLAAVLESLASEGYCRILDTSYGPTPSPFATHLLGFPECRLTIMPNTIRPLRFLVERRAAMPDEHTPQPLGPTVLFDGYNLLALLAFLHRSRFERLAPVQIPAPLTWQRTRVR